MLSAVPRRGLSSTAWPAPTTEGFRLLEEHVARAPQIDRALKAGGHFRMGPLELTDFIGGTSTIRSVGKSGRTCNTTRAIPRPPTAFAGRCRSIGKKNGRSYFAVEENAPPVMAATDADIETLHVYGEHPFYPVTTTCRASVAQLRVEQRPALPGTGPAVRINDAFTVSITDGARQTSWPSRRRRMPLWSMSP